MRKLRVTMKVTITVVPFTKRGRYRVWVWGLRAMLAVHENLTTVCLLLEMFLKGAFRDVNIDNSQRWYFNVDSSLSPCIWIYQLRFVRRYCILVLIILCALLSTKSCSLRTPVTLYIPVKIIRFYLRLPYLNERNENGADLMCWKRSKRFDVRCAVGNEGGTFMISETNYCMWESVINCVLHKTLVHTRN